MQRDRLTDAEVTRYSRHLLLPEVGLEGQQRLKSARVLVVGAGGLGSPVGIYLAAAGVGTIGIVDFDDVELSNLQRQPLHGHEDLGRSKVESAGSRLSGINPHVAVARHHVRLTSEHALKVLEGYDLVVDGTDNFPTRYLVNDACVLLGIPMVYGSVYRFEGQTSIFATSSGPCYRCLYPRPPPPYLAPSCAEGGVLGVVPGLVGLVQATEAVKWILGIGTSLEGRLLLLDALRMSWREIKIARDPSCPVCGTHPTITSLVDYEAFCRSEIVPLQDGADASEIAVTSPEAVQGQIADGQELVLLDVRSRGEWELGHLEGAYHIPLSELPGRMGEVARDVDIVLYCHWGVRSRQAAALLCDAGFRRVAVMEGGLEAWAERIDPGLVRY